MVNPLKYYNNNLCGTEVLLESMVAHGVNKIVFLRQQPHMENRNVFLYLKQTAQFQQTVMAKQSFPWRRCLNGQPMPMIYVLYPYVISMPVEHIQTEKSGKLIIRRRI